MFARDPLFKGSTPGQKGAVARGVSKNTGSLECACKSGKVLAAVWRFPHNLSRANPKAPPKESAAEALFSFLLEFPISHKSYMLMLLHSAKV